jgi:hypothetical protein
MKTRRPGFGYGRLLRRTALNAEKMAVLAPMPRASVTVAAAYPGFRRAQGIANHGDET